MSLSPVLFILLHASCFAQDGEYQLGPGDKIRLKVVEWRASKDEIFSWDPLNDVYTIGSSGELSLPLVGEVSAGGHTRAEVASIVARQFANGMRLGVAPSVAVEIAEYRPFFIVGRVLQPGAFPFQPGLTVLKAVSLAGGLGSASLDPLAQGRNLISTSGDLNVLALERMKLAARAARLDAEQKDRTEISFPPELTDEGSTAAAQLLVRQETAIFLTRREAFHSQLSAVKRLKGDLGAEVPLLVGQIEKVDEQIASIRDELASVASLVKSGLTPGSRQAGLERALAQIEGERLRLDSSLLHAKQEISRAELSLVTLQSERAKEIAANLRETQAQLDEAAERIHTKRELLESDEANALYLLPDASSPLPRSEPVYRIVRTADGTTSEFAATEASLVQPGDTIKVLTRRLTGSDS